MMFVGRWTPFHNGHKAIIEKKINENPDKPVLIMVRSTNYDRYHPFMRAKLIEIWMRENNIKGTIMIIPDIEGIYWGRGVGYNTQRVRVPEYIEKISATAIRKYIKDKNKKWKKDLASETIASLVQEKTANILQKGLVIWLTGCPCSGKTTIALKFTKKVKRTFPYLKLQVLDGDVMRNTPLSSKLGFSKKDRAEHIRKMGFLAKMFADHGVLVVCAFVSPDEMVRKEIGHMVGKRRFVEIYVKADQKSRIKRDIKGMYQKAIKGEISNFTGYNAPYDEPKNPDLICNTDKESVNESVAKVYQYIFS